MSENPSPLKCRTCGQSFTRSQKPGGGWRIAFDKKPPSTICKAHIGSALCRWEVHKQRRQLRRKIAPFFQGKPASFLTLVPPQRLVAYDQLTKLNLENEKRAMRRVLRKALPKDTVLVSVFDISLADDATSGASVRHWVPHFHVLVAGVTAAELRKACRHLYRGTKKVRRPIHVRDAPTPKNGLNYALKHIDDVNGDTIFSQATGSGNRSSRRRWLKKEERALLKEFVSRNSLSTYLYLKGFRRLK